MTDSQKVWKVDGNGLETRFVRAEDFDEAIKIARTFNPCYDQAQIYRPVYGYYNGTPFYTEEEFKHACRRRGAFASDEELIAFSEKVSYGRWKLGGYLSDYALSEPRKSLTRAEFNRLNELNEEAIAEHRRAEEARQWRYVRTIYWADNSEEEIWEDKDGVQKTVMTVGPHGDACF